MCGLSEKIAAAAAMIASITETQVLTCKPARAVPLMMLAGTLDTLVPYEGRQQAGIKLLPVMEAFVFWARRNDCREVRETAWGEATGSRPPQPFLTTVVEISGCASGDIVRLYRVDGGGHTLPSKRPQSEEERKRVGPRSTEFETSEEVWAFLSLFKL